MMADGRMTHLIFAQSILFKTHFILFVLDQSMYLILFMHISAHNIPVIILFETKYAELALNKAYLR